MSEAPVPQAVNTQPTPESERATNIAFLLDVDGVLTDPSRKDISGKDTTTEVDPQVFTKIIEQLSAGTPIALNTGRSIEWLENNVLTKLNAQVADKKILNNLFAVGEKGLTWASFDPTGRLKQGVFNAQGKPVEGYDLSQFLDPETAKHFQTLSAEAKELIAKEYSHSTFFDTTKKAMVSTEMHGTFDHARFEQEQGVFTEKLKAIVNRLGLQEQFTVDPTGIATDVQLKTVQEKDASGKVIAKNPVGKHLGARRILRWLELNKVNPKLFISVGDSSSDLEMEDELTAQGKANEFYYVRPDKPLDDKTLKDTKGNARKNIHTTKAKHSNGLLEVFDSVKKAA
jgi:hypothetical protein